jgi:NAD(P)H-hydrate repair Nnr-like enzyme with NAD(P)H-hydrate epimerase domain
MTWLGKLGAFVVLALATLGVLGCGETVIDSAKTEGAIEENLEKSVGQKVASVDCPSGVKVEKGNTFECTVKLKNGKTETATLKVLNSEADVELTNIKSAGGK